MAITEHRASLLQQGHLEALSIGKALRALPCSQNGQKWQLALCLGPCPQVTSAACGPHLLVPFPYLWEEPYMRTILTSQAAWMKTGVRTRSPGKKGERPLPRQGPGPQSPPALTGVVHEKNAFPMTRVFTSLLSPSPHPTPHVLSSILSQDPL